MRTIEHAAFSGFYPSYSQYRFILQSLLKYCGSPWGVLSLRPVCFSLWYLLGRITNLWQFRSPPTRRQVSGAQKQRQPFWCHQVFLHWRDVWQLGFLSCHIKFKCGRGVFLVWIFNKSNLCKRVQPIDFSASGLTSERITESLSRFLESCREVSFHFL